MTNSALCWGSSIMQQKCHEYSLPDRDGTLKFNFIIFAKPLRIIESRATWKGCQAQEANLTWITKPMDLQGRNSCSWIRRPQQNVPPIRAYRLRQTNARGASRVTRCTAGWSYPTCRIRKTSTDCRFNQLQIPTSSARTQTFQAYLSQLILRLAHRVLGLQFPRIANLHPSMNWGMIISYLFGSLLRWKQLFLFLSSNILYKKRPAQFGTPILEPQILEAPISVGISPVYDQQPMMLYTEGNSYSPKI